MFKVQTTMHLDCARHFDTITSTLVDVLQSLGSGMTSLILNPFDDPSIAPETLFPSPHQKGATSRRLVYRHLF